MNRKERDMARDKKIDELIDKVDLIIAHLGLNKKEEEGEENEG